MKEDDGSPKYYGIYKGFIRDNRDPEGRGRLVCYCPQVMGPEDSRNQWLGWAEPKLVWLGGLNTGFFGSPFTRKEQIDSEGREWMGVWLLFEQGCLDFPVWDGTFLITPSDNPEVTLVSSGGDGIPGGTLIGSGTSETGPLNPPRAEATKEVRLLAPKGVDIVLVAKGGGALILGESGAHLTGVQVTLNGKPIQASSTDGG